MTQLTDFKEAIQALVEDLKDSFQQINADEVGLDRRCGHLYVSQEAVIIERHSHRSFNYYGGFEYIDSDLYDIIGEYIIYYPDPDKDSCRIGNIIESWLSKDNPEVVIDEEEEKGVFEANETENKDKPTENQG